MKGYSKTIKLILGGFLIILLIGIAGEYKLYMDKKNKEMDRYIRFQAIAHNEMVSIMSSFTIYIEEHKGNIKDVVSSYNSDKIILDLEKLYQILLKSYEDCLITTKYIKIGNKYRNFIDPNHREYHFIIKGRNLDPTDIRGAKGIMIIWSDGLNKKNENGKGDDIVSSMSLKDVTSKDEN